jgi:hypothetical protein
MSGVGGVLGHLRRLGLNGRLRRAILAARLCCGRHISTCSLRQAGMPAYPGLLPSHTPARISGLFDAWSLLDGTYLC